MEIKSPAEWEPMVAAAAAIFRHHRSQRRALSTSGAERSGWLGRARRGASEHVRRSGRDEGAGA